ncbi:hypothetical protein CEXT_769631 [Caerostris extrusa]|uniref:LRRCT domain-containing protein n=1 Tax=Caerostris extrusa TaxID=172846 RepID=A0AAV4U3C7_CAEEX|nr:hypothetical protein CEXT_769631 [Caerostris extrusa]
MRFLFLDHNLICKPPVFLLESLEFLTRVTLSNNPWTCDCAALDFKKWIVSKSMLVSIKTLYFLGQIRQLDDDDAENVIFKGLSVGRVELQKAPLFFKKIPEKKKHRLSASEGQDSFHHNPVTVEKNERKLLYTIVSFLYILYILQWVTSF